MLGPREVVPYLQARGYLTTSGAVLDGITIEDASRRNTQFESASPARHELFLETGSGRGRSRAPCSRSLDLPDPSI